MVYVCPDTHKHAEAGTCWTHHKCRCKPCKRRENKRVADSYRYTRQIKGMNRRVPALGAARRLQALAVMGWPCSRIAELSGIDIMHLNETRRMLRDNIYLTTHERIDAVYRAYSTRRNEERGAGFTRAHALRHGWVSPAAWDHIDDPRERPKGAAA